MSPERWQQIEEIFQDALDLPWSEREKFVAEKCGNDADLKAEVEKLLLQFEDAGSFIETPALSDEKASVLSSLMEFDEDDPMIGTLLGSYRIEREIGRGGMGAVYEAIRADGEFRRKAAIKIVKRGMDTDFILRRFRNERQILATLEHPYITRLLDGGTTDDGRPYFVMDYIEGLPLYRYCDKNRLTIKERLNLFTKVCEAVEYAHQNLVIHRDLKPSNILVSNDGTPRLLDFGIAKLLNPELASDTLQPTATAMRMMTIDYASPEQINGEKVTFSTDIYSLGVILFELLTGHRPYRFPNRTPHEIARVICEEPLILPSNAINHSENTLPLIQSEKDSPTLKQLAELRGETPEKLSQSLRGNPDNITLKALQKSPDERYESIKKFLEDIEKHLAGKAVSASVFASSPTKQTSLQPIEKSKLIAVLPLKLLNFTLTEMTDENYLSLGLADAIISRLTNIKGFTVRPTSSIAGYEKTDVDPLRAGKELGVDFVLDGRIKKFGDNLRVSVQMLDAGKGSTVWAGQFDEKFADVLALEDAISEKIAEALVSQVTGESEVKLGKRGTDNPQAYEAYLKGRFYWNQFTADSLPKAIEQFQKAVELDPNYALAYVGVADFYIWANIYGLIPSLEATAKAEESVNKALAIDDQLGEAYATCGLIKQNKFDWQTALELYPRAIELNPNYPNVYEWHSAFLVGSGERAKGALEIEKAERLDPLSLRTKTLVAWTNYQAGEFRKALAKANEIIDLDENYPQGHLQKGYILTEIGDAEEAVREIEKGLRLMSDSALAKFYYCFALVAAGRTEEARKIRDEMLASKSYVKPYFAAMASVAVGEFDAAFKSLDESADEFEPWLVWLGTDPKLKKIHSDKRYLDLLRKVKNPRLKYFESQIDSLAETEIDIHQSNIPTKHFPPVRTKIHTEKSDTKAEEVTQTAEVASPSFFQKHKYKFVASGIFAAFIFAAYAGGIFTVNVSSDEAKTTAAKEQIIAASQVKELPDSIVILPFKAEDASDSEIGVGLADALTANLGAVKRLSVLSANSGRAVANSEPQNVGRELGVQYVLRSRVAKNGTGFNIESELIKTADNKRMWQENIETKEQDLFAVLPKIGLRILEALKIEPLPVEKEQLEKKYTDNGFAYALFLVGRSQMANRSPENIRKAIGTFSKAAEADPNFALAYVGLADAYNLRNLYEIPSPPDTYPKAIEYAKKALAVDSELPSARVSLAYASFFYLRNRETAELEYRRAIQLNPSNAQAHNWFSAFLAATNRLPEAISEAKTAIRLDPRSLSAKSGAGLTYFYNKQFDEAISEANNALAAEQNFLPAIRLLRWIYQSEGNYQRAKEIYQRERLVSTEGTEAEWYMIEAQVEALSDKKAEVLNKLNASVEEAGVKENPNAYAYEIALAYHALGERNKTFEWLEKAETASSYGFNFLEVDHRFETLRNDQRYQKLLQNLKTPRK